MSERIGVSTLSSFRDTAITLSPWSLHPILADRLKRLLPASVTVLNVAASNQDGYCELHIPIFHGKDIDTRCSLEADVNPEFMTRMIRVEKRRLDGLPLGGRKVAVIKMDVEGHELRALQGLAGILEESKPSIIVESEARHNAGAPFNVFDFLLSYGYEGYFIYRSNLRRISEFSVETFQVETAAKSVSSERSPDYVNNFIFVHPSRNAVLDGVRQVFPSVTPTSKR